MKRHVSRIAIDQRVKDFPEFRSPVDVLQLFIHPAIHLLMHFLKVGRICVDKSVSAANHYVNIIQSIKIR